tara:strand:- start:826 stop:1089 length:264 start_codon:yes stop_codon:yes gene_type:complete
MSDSMKCILNAVIIGTAINIVLPIILKQFASEKEIKPPNGVENLSFKEQFIHMMVHHGQVPLTSSIVIAIVIGVSILLGNAINPSKL